LYFGAFYNKMGVVVTRINIGVFAAFNRVNNDVSCSTAPIPRDSLGVSVLGKRVAHFDCDSAEPLMKLRPERVTSIDNANQGVWLVERLRSSYRGLALHLPMGNGAWSPKKHNCGGHRPSAIQQIPAEGILQAFETPYLGAWCNSSFVELLINSSAGASIQQLMLRLSVEQRERLGPWR